MPVRIDYLKRIDDFEDPLKNSEKVPTRGKRKMPQNISWIILIEGRQVGHIFNSKPAAFAYIERQKLYKKLPTITAVTEPLTTKCGICRETASIMEYRIDKIIYLCENNHKSEIKRY